MGEYLSEYEDLLSENIAFEQDEVWEAADVLKRLQAQSEQDAKIGLLLEHAQKLGFTPSTEPKNVQGFKHIVRAKKPVRDETSGREISELAFEMNIQDLTKQGTSDVLAIVTLQMSARDLTLQMAPSDLSESYAMLLEMPGGAIDLARELTVGANQVVQANSWWDRTKLCLRGRCPRWCAWGLIICLPALIFGFGTYWSCVIRRCGACATYCAACATCQCRWWCKWATGCCS